DIFKEKCLPDPKQIEMLNKLKKHYKLCLCSNSKRKTVEVFLSKSDTASFFDFYLSNEDVSKSKPDPEIYNKAIKMLNLSPQQCLIVEDNFNGIKAAKASGAYVMEIKDIREVNYQNIINKINEIQK